MNMELCSKFLIHKTELGFYENDFIDSNVLDIISWKVTEIFSG
jgi:hypothetical protein